MKDTTRKQVAGYDTICSFRGLLSCQTATAVEAALDAAAAAAAVAAVPVAPVAGFARATPPSPTTTKLGTTPTVVFAILGPESNGLERPTGDIGMQFSRDIVELVRLPAGTSL